MFTRTKTPSQRQLREFGLITAFILGWRGILALRATLQGPTPRPEIILLGLAIGALLITVFRPHLLHWPFAVLSTVTYPLGILLSALLIRILYYFVIAPVSLWHLIRGVDPLKWKASPKLPSYLQRAESSPDPAEYRNMY